MKKFKNRQRPRRKYRFDIVGHKKALKIWWDSPFKGSGEIVGIDKKGEMWWATCFVGYVTMKNPREIAASL